MGGLSSLRGGSVGCLHLGVGGLSSFRDGWTCPHLGEDAWTCPHLGEDAWLGAQAGNADESVTCCCKVQQSFCIVVVLLEC